MSVIRYATRTETTESQEETLRRAEHYVFARAQFAFYEERMRGELRGVSLEWIDRRKVVALCRGLYRLRYAGADYRERAAKAVALSGLPQRLAAAICDAATAAMGKKDIGNSVKRQTEQ